MLKEFIAVSFYFLCDITANLLTEKEARFGGLRYFPDLPDSIIVINCSQFYCLKVLVKYMYLSPCLVLLLYN